MSFTRQKPGDWAFGEVLTSSQMNGIDLNLSRALDGHGGGTYNLTADLEILDELVYAEFFQAKQATIDEGMAVGASGTGSLTVASDLSVGDDLTVTDDAAIGGDLTVTGSLTSGIASFLLNNSNVVDSSEELFDGFQGTPIRFYTGTASSLVTDISTTTTVYHWFWLINAQSTTRTIANTGGGTIATLSSNQWCVVAKISTLNSWRVIARGSLT